MTNNFDTLLESTMSKLISEAPASMEGSPEEMASSVSKKIEELPGKSGHWGPLQKLTPGDRERIIRAIIRNVFTEKGNTYTPMADDPAQLKELVKSAIVNTTKAYPEFKAGGKWAVQFLADRLTNKELLGNVKYTTEGGQEIKKDVTQKEMKAALNAALGDTKGQSVWRKSSQSEEMPPEEVPAAAPEAAEVPEKGEVETFYIKAADWSSDDAELQRAFGKVPNDKDLSWDQIIAVFRKAGFAKPTSTALGLFKAGGLVEIEKEKEANEDGYVPALDAAEDEGPLTFNKAMDYADPSFRTTKGSGNQFWND